MLGITPDQFATWADETSVLDVVLWGAGVIAVVLFLWWFKRKGWPWLVKFAQAIVKTATVIDSVQGLPDFITRTDATLKQQNESIASIHHETHRNDGSSIKDSTIRLEEAVERIELGVKGLYDTDAELAERLHELEDTRDHPPTEE